MQGRSSIQKFHTFPYLLLITRPLQSLYRVEEMGKERGGDVQKNPQAQPDGYDVQEAITHPFFPQETNKGTDEAEVSSGYCDGLEA